MSKEDYPPEEKCLAQRADEPNPCQNARRSCELHCNANLRKKPGQRCAQWPMANGRCRIHGGKSLKAGAHPGFRDGSPPSTASGASSTSATSRRSPTPSSRTTVTPWRFWTP